MTKLTTKQQNEIVDTLANRGMLRSVSRGRTYLVRSWTSVARMLGLTAREYVRMHFSLARIGYMLGQ